MKSPKLKRNTTTSIAPEFPVNAFLRHNPLPPHLTHLEPALRSPFGESLLNVIATCANEGITDQAELRRIAESVIDFHGQEWQRCNSCFGWSKNFHSGAFILDGVFSIVVICDKCGQRVLADDIDSSMERNIAEAVGLGGAR